MPIPRFWEHITNSSKSTYGLSSFLGKKIAEITWEQVKAIATDKMPDLNCFTVEAAMRMVAGTARSLGITVKGEFPSEN